jgi:hypothetical protein
MTMEVTLTVVVTGCVYIYISRNKEEERKGSCSLLPVGAGEYRELELPSGWSLILVEAGEFGEL